MKIVTYGGGTNSTALLIGLRNNEQTPDAIVFSDTGGEKPHTYEYIERMQLWCKRNGFPEITIVQKGGKKETLEEELLRRNSLPAIAFGFKTCSQKYKVQPFEQWCNKNEDCQKVWEQGGKVKKYIGIDADEPQRVRLSPNKKFENIYPLVDWDWGREDCIDIIKNERLPLPGKSSCFFCPSSKAQDILNLPQDLKDRAMTIEKRFFENDDGEGVKGLGRSWSWTHLIKTADQQVCFPFYQQDAPCDCYDG